MQIPDDVWTPIPVANYTNSDHVRSFPLRKKVCRITVDNVHAPLALSGFLERNQPKLSNALADDPVMGTIECRNPKASQTKVKGQATAINEHL